MCPLIRPDMIVPILFFTLLFFWLIAIPIFIIARLEKIVKLLEAKNRN